MLKDVVSVIPSDPYRLKIRFEDGVEGSVALDELVSFEGIFASLRDSLEFRKVGVHPELGVVCWPNGADLDSGVTLRAHHWRVSRTKNGGDSLISSLPQRPLRLIVHNPRKPSSPPKRQLCVCEEGVAVPSFSSFFPTTGAYFDSRSLRWVRGSLARFNGMLSPRLKYLSSWIVN